MRAKKKGRIANLAKLSIDFEKKKRKSIKYKKTKQHHFRLNITVEFGIFEYKCVAE